MEPTRRSFSRLARAKLARWPAWRAPMVGWKPTRRPASRAAAVEAASSALLATARTAPQPPQQLAALLRVLTVAELAAERRLDPEARLRVEAAGGGRLVGDQLGEGDVHVDDLLLAGEGFGVHGDGAAVTPDPWPRHARLAGVQGRVDAGVDQVAQQRRRVDHPTGTEDVGGLGRQPRRAVGRQHERGMVAHATLLRHVHGAATEGADHLAAGLVAGHAPDRAWQAGDGGLQVVVADLHRVAGGGAGAGGLRRREQ